MIYFGQWCEATTDCCGNEIWTISQRLKARNSRFLQRRISIAGQQSQVKISRMTFSKFYRNDHSTTGRSSQGLPINTLPVRLLNSIMMHASVVILSIPAAPGGLSLQIENGAPSSSESLSRKDRNVVGTFVFKSSSVNFFMRARRVIELRAG